MNGPEYEIFVRAALAQRLKIPRDKITSTRPKGLSLPGAAGVKHQIDLMFVQDSEIAEYTTIVECKYRSSAPVDQPEIQNLAFVRDNMRAQKAIMVTNTEFTAGARAVAESQKIALLVIAPKVEVTDCLALPDEKSILAAVEAKLNEIPKPYDIVVVQRCFPDPNDRGSDLIVQLLKSPEVRDFLKEAIKRPDVRETASRIARENPDLARQAMSFLKRF